MIKLTAKFIAVLGSASLIAACASTQPSDQSSATSGLPAWVITPGNLVDDGSLVATECVSANAGMSILKAKSIALARGNLAQQIQVNVQAMDDTYRDLTENGGQSGSGSTFSSVTKQVTDQMLSGAIPERVDYIKGPNDTTLFCSMVVMAPEKNRKIFEQIIDRSNRQMSPENEALLYQEFRAKRAADELKNALGG
ncbi:LPP20 family lipoprotein [Marinobacter sp. S6332]|uniref:LPP20 family lipoprotein n=1 Tax=Marinobacter sp. S6332 TaxID=2926403 RepID=UPI001FF548EF|nr:LPP20 family lipoprotein [Marinobacter sp. S6332]MCK0162352.1 LPP20 family lipoprotein [Marinobacter sp. S6332]